MKINQIIQAANEQKRISKGAQKRAIKQANFNAYKESERINRRIIRSVDGLTGPRVSKPRTYRG